MIKFFDMTKYLDMDNNELDNILSNDPDIEISKKKKNNHICVHCKSDKIICDTVKNINICTDCGVIIDEFLDEFPDFTNDSEINNSRYGQPSSFFFPKASLGTKIVSKKYNRLSLIQRQGQMPYKEKNLMEELEKIQIKCKQHNISQTIIDSVKILYKKIFDSTHSNGKREGKSIIMRCENRRSMVAACLFYACNIQNEMRSPKEIAEIYDMDVKCVNKGCKTFCDIMDKNFLFDRIKSSYPIDFVNRFAKLLNIDDEHIEIIKMVCNNLTALDSVNTKELDCVNTHEPPSVAAGCILLVCVHYNLNVEKKDISKIFKISEVTISKTYRHLEIISKIILDQDITKKVIEKQKKLLKLSN